MKPSNIAKTFTIAAVTALALGIAPKAKADCSEATLKGHHFAYTSTGSIVAAPIPSSSAGGPMPRSVCSTSTGRAMLPSLSMPASTAA